MKAYLAKFFSPQRKLEQVIVDLPELLAQPAAMLAKNDIRIGPINPILAIFSFLLLGLAVPMKFAHSWDWSTEGIGLAIGAALGMFLWYSNRHYEIRLTTDGVVFQRGRREVRCPWALFNTAGNPLPLNAFQLTLPVSSAAVPYVQLHQDECFRAQGAEVKTNFFRFRAGGTLWLRYRYEALPGEVGELLLRLGRMLGTRSPSGWTPPEACPAEEIQDVAIGIAEADGAITLSLTRLFFPQMCCACGQATNEEREFQIDVRWGKLLAFLGGGHAHRRTVDIPIPMCAWCQEHFRRASRRGFWLGTIVSLLMLATLFGLIMLAADMLAKAAGVLMMLVVIFMLVLLISAMLSWSIGRSLAEWYCSPLRSASYSARRATVYLRFRRAEYAELVAEYVRNLEKRNGKE